MPTILTNGVNLHHETFGEHGEPVLLLHGAMSDAMQNWRMILPALSAKHRVIGVDLRGHGKSDNPTGEFTLEALTGDIAGLLDALDVPRVHVLGCSLGGYVSLMLRDLLPERIGSLALAGVKVGWDEAHATARFDFFQPHVIAETYPLWLPHMAKAHSTHYGPDHWKTLVGWVGSALKALPGMPSVGLARLAAEAETRALFYALGDRDELVPLSETVVIREARPDAEILVVPRAGHLFRQYNATVFSAAYLEFLKKNPSNG